jgi:group I intron endonuclease
MGWCDALRKYNHIGGIIIMCKKRISGIYLIKNVVTKRVRTGSTKDIIKRFSNYKARLRNGNGNKLMQEDYNMFGEQSFEFIILEECNIKDLYIREKYYLDLYKDCAMYNKNDIANVKKKIRRGREAGNYKKLRSEVTSGEKNGHNTKLSKEKVFDILDMDLEGIDRKIIAEKYDIYPAYISRLGKDRWVKEFKEWKENRKGTIPMSEIDIIPFLNVSSNIASINANLN